MSEKVFAKITGMEIPLKKWLEIKSKEDSEIKEEYSSMCESWKKALENEDEFSRSIEDYVNRPGNVFTDKKQGDDIAAYLQCTFEDYEPDNVIVGICTLFCHPYTTNMEKSIEMSLSERNKRELRLQVWLEENDVEDVNLKEYLLWEYVIPRLY